MCVLFTKMQAPFKSASPIGSPNAHIADHLVRISGYIAIENARRVLAPCPHDAHIVIL
jgi:hypothetical protein